MDREIAPEPDLFGMFPHQPGTDGVESPGLS